MTIFQNAVREASSKLGISQTVLFNLLKERDFISDEIKKNGNLSYKSKCDVKSDDIESALLNWFKYVRIQKLPVSHSTRCEKHSNLIISLKRKTLRGWMDS